MDFALCKNKLLLLLLLRSAFKISVTKEPITIDCYRLLDVKYMRVLLWQTKQLQTSKPWNTSCMQTLEITGSKFAITREIEGINGDSQTLPDQSGPRVNGGGNPTRSTPDIKLLLARARIILSPQC